MTNKIKGALRQFLAAIVFTDYSDNRALVPESV